MKILARHKWVDGAVISESVDADNNRRFTATIRGWRNWKIYEGPGLKRPSVQEIIKKVESIRDRIDKGDENIFLDSKNKQEEK